MSQSEALIKIRESSGWWRPDVYQAFLRTLNKVSAAA
jgi:hypothetical protein